MQKNVEICALEGTVQTSSNDCTGPCHPMFETKEASAVNFQSSWSLGCCGDKKFVLERFQRLEVSNEVP